MEFKKLKKCKINGKEQIVYQEYIHGIKHNLPFYWVSKKTKMGREYPWKKRLTLMEWGKC